METSSLTYSVVEGDDFRSNTSLKNRIVQLISQSYQNTQRLIDRIYSVNDIAFVAHVDEVVVGVLLFNYQNRATILADDQLFTAIYNGYAVTDIQYRNQRVIQHLISFATAEFDQRVQQENSQLLLYAITSNPYALRAYRNVCEYMEPFTDGSFTQEGGFLVNQLKKELGITVSEDSHPFKFTTSLPQRYSDFERINLDKAPEAERLFLQKLGVDESIGDRIIFFWGPKDLLVPVAIAKALA